MLRSTAEDNVEPVGLLLQANPFHDAFPADVLPLHQVSGRVVPQPRKQRGGNVWQHLRSFHKRLFDAIPDEALRVDGEYIELASDWAFMLPIVEIATKPVHLTEPLYLHEPSGSGKGTERAKREATIIRIVRKGLHSAAGKDRDQDDQPAMPDLTMNTIMES